VTCVGLQVQLYKWRCLWIRQRKQPWCLLGHRFGHLWHVLREFFFAVIYFLLQLGMQKWVPIIATLVAIVVPMDTVLQIAHAFVSEKARAARVKLSPWMVVTPDELVHINLTLWMMPAALRSKAVVHRSQGGKS